MRKLPLNTILQITSFSFILVNGFITVPYIYSIFIGTFFSSELYSIMGILGLVFSFLSAFYYPKSCQLLASIFMFLSLMFFFTSKEIIMETNLFKQLSSKISLFIFLATQAYIIYTNAAKNKKLNKI